MISLEKYLDKIPLGLEKKEPYIMKEADFDNENFYKYILKCSVYYLHNEVEKTINDLPPVIIKHLIDWLNFLDIILS